MTARLQPKIVIAFDSTHEALHCEYLCRRAGVAGRLIPTPTSIRADCGLAWSMPGTAWPHFEHLIQPQLLCAGRYELEL